MKVVASGFMVAAIAAAASLLYSGDTPVERGIEIDQSRDISALLEECPPPCSAEKDDLKTRDEIISQLKLISEYPIPQIRRGIDRFVESRGGVPLAPGDESKLIILNRLLFNVERDNERANALWPLSIDAKGEVSFSGTFGPSSGPLFFPLEEFDEFNGRFGCRFK